VFGYADKDAARASTTMTVDASKSCTVSMPKGSFVKYTTKQWSYYKTLGPHLLPMSWKGAARSFAATSPRIERDQQRRPRIAGQWFK
jgi:hypothetical protein